MYPDKHSPGYGVFVKNIAEALSNFGIENAYSAVIRGRASSKLNKCYKYIKLYFDILKQYNKNYEFVYIHFPNQVVPILFPLLFLKKKKLLVNLHGEDLIYENKGYGKYLGKMMEQMCKKYADAIIVPSEYFKHELSNRKIVSLEKIIVSPSGGIDSQNFFPSFEVPSKNRPVHLGYVGRMEEDKGIIEFLETCKILKESNIDYSATAIGYGSCYEFAQLYIINNQLSNVKLMAGLPQKELGNYYRSFDLLIFSSSRKSESLGLTGIESMACGTPIIGSDIGGIATYTISGYNGWLTPIRDVKSIIKYIMIYLRLSYKEKCAMRHNAAITGERYYSNVVAEDLKNKILSIFKIT